MMMKPSEMIDLARDCDAIRVPSGEAIVLPRGMQVYVSQRLGGTFTVVTDQGYMARIAARDADALGFEAAPEAAAAADASKTLEEQIWDRLRTCYDPEIPVNIVELGLVYGCELKPAPPESEGRHDVEIRMTLTAPGCGMGPVLQQDIERKLRELPGIRAARVELVFDPPWDQSRMSEAARLELGMY
jgi:probable FeS assembly SUF system protein SufT